MAKKRGRPKAETTKIVERAIRRATDKHGRFAPPDVVQQMPNLVPTGQIPYRDLVYRWLSGQVRRVLNQRDRHGHRVYVCVRNEDEDDYFKRFLDLNERELALVCAYRGKQAADLGRSHDELLTLFELVREERKRTGKEITVEDVIAQLEPDGASG